MYQDRLFTYKQNSPFQSPREKKELCLLLLWQWAWTIFCSWTPKPLNSWRLIWLKLFGCKLSGSPFVHPRARIEVPWNLTLHHRSCLGDGANVYSLGEIELRARCTVAQESYLCSGTHQFSDANLPLQVGKIIIGEDAFLGARTFIMPGITIGDGAVIGACSVVTKDMPAWTICYGHPCAPVKPRIMK